MSEPESDKVGDVSGERSFVGARIRSLVQRGSSLDWEAATRALRLDPPQSRVGRLVRFIAHPNVMADGPGFAAAAAGIVQTAAKSGLSVKTVHRIHAMAHPHRMAMRDRRRGLTYREADAEIDAFARGLMARLGVGRGDAVVLMMRNRVEYLVSWFALFRLGARAVHVSYDATPDEFEWMASHSEAKAAVVDEAVLERIGGTGWSGALLVCGEPGDHVGAQPWSGILEFGPEPFAPSDAASESVVYTSGTTGRPKGAVRDFSAMGPAELLRIVDRMPLRPGDRHLVVARLYHSGAQAFALLATSLGATLVIRDEFDAADMWRALSSFGIHHTFVVPTMLRRLLALPQELRDAHPISELRAVVSGAAPFPHALRLEVIDVFGPDSVFDFYGATELGWVTLTNGREMLDRPGTLGRALDGQEIRIVGEDGAPVPVGETGVVQVRNGQAMVGYLKNVAASEDVVRDGWATVDDTGRLDEDGYLYLSGRARDMLISGGVNIYPAEVEHVLGLHPSIMDIAVVGLPDPEWGERVAAVVVVAGEHFDPETVVAWARERMARYKVPRVWEIRSELPRNATGKVLKRQIRDELSGETS